MHSACSHDLHLFYFLLFWTFNLIPCKIVEKVQFFEVVNFSSASFRTCKDFVEVFLQSLKITHSWQSWNWGPSINYVMPKLAIFDPPPPPCNTFGQYSDWFKKEKNPIVTLGQTPTPFWCNIIYGRPLENFKTYIQTSILSTSALSFDQRSLFSKHQMDRHKISQLFLTGCVFCKLVLKRPTLWALWLVIDDGKSWCCNGDWQTEMCHTGFVNPFVHPVPRIRSTRSLQCK